MPLEKVLFGDKVISFMFFISAVNTKNNSIYFQFTSVIFESIECSSGNKVFIFFIKDYLLILFRLNVKIP